MCRLLQVCIACCFQNCELHYTSQYLLCVGYMRTQVNIAASDKNQLIFYVRLKQQQTSILHNSSDGIETPDFVGYVERFEDERERSVPATHSLNGGLQVVETLSL